MLDLTLIAFAFSTLLIGLLCGFLLGRSMSAGNKKARDTERQLEEVRKSQDSYKAEVTEHFSNTALLLNKLTDSYREVHSHLATGAQALCEGQDPVIPGRLADDANPALPDLEDIQPPLDYAPKTSENVEGVLSETFGLDQAGLEPVRQEAPQSAAVEVEVEVEDEVRRG